MTDEKTLHEFSRAELVLGKESIEKLKKSKVAVFGVGGVGSYAVEALVRCGVGKLVLIDNDCVCITNINRQIHATMKTVGKPKVEVMRDRVLDINPKVEVIIHQKFYLPDTAEELFADDYNYLIDAIDTVTGKIDLVVRAKAMNIPIISSMGAGNKIDPTRFEVADIYATSICPLAKVMRKELRKRNIDSLKVVYSTEEPIKPNRVHMPELTCNDGANSNTKRQLPGSVSFVPSVAGLIIAGEVVKDLINK